jgi:hypothetical protein
MVSKTGRTLLCTRLMTCRISAVALCWACDSARRFSSSRTLEPWVFRNVGATERSASTLAFEGFALRRGGRSLRLKEWGAPAD